METKFDIGDKVIVRSNRLIGIVSEIRIREDIIKYKIINPSMCSYHEEDEINKYNKEAQLLRLIADKVEDGEIKISSYSSTADMGMTKLSILFDVELFVSDLLKEVD